jgi:hypothetical protein
MKLIPLLTTTAALAAVVVWRGFNHRERHLRRV